MKNIIEIDFYLSPRLCSNPLHKIDFLLEDDRYNPFSRENFYTKVMSRIDEEIYEKVVELVMSQDLVQNKLVEIKKAQEINKKLLPFLKNVMQENNIEFKATSKYSMQSAFAKLAFNNCHSKTKLFFQLLGKKKKCGVELTGMVFLRCVASST